MITEDEINAADEHLREEVLMGGDWTFGQDEYLDAYGAFREAVGFWEASVRPVKGQAHDTLRRIIDEAKP